MAKEFFAGERDALDEQRRLVEQEKEALDLGGLMWKDVAVTVTEFEKKVRVEMSGTDMANSGHAWDDLPQSTPTERLKELLLQMGTVIKDLQAKSRKAEENNWKLLIAAIGAELDALEQGKSILENVLGETLAEPEPLGVDADARDEIAISELDSGDELRGLDKSFETARRRGSNGAHGDTDDEPDPELLFSRQDTDTE